MKPPLILFPHEPFVPRQIDSEFLAEYNAACTIGFATAFYDHEAIASNGAKTALKLLPNSEEKQILILRGWMLPGEKYGELYKGLVAKGYLPQTSPDQYEQAHYIPNAYPITKEHSPKTEWIEGDDVTATWDMYQNFSHSECIIKDWVKSAKSRWKDGCYIPANTNENNFKEIYKIFREERSKLFNRGVVLREFMPIQEKGSDIRGLPLIEETRLFFWKGNLLVRPNSDHPSPLDELSRWEAIANKFSSPFITIDVAYLTDGTWKIVEVGDGGVSGLPMGLDPDRFYASLWNAV